MKRTWILTMALALAALPAFAGGTVYHGTDLWITPGNGSTFSDFASNPLPSGFFCARSAAFTGKIAFRGEPLATDAPGVLRNADTVIERLDDAQFDVAGKAATRLKVRALNLVSVAPVVTACGAFNVRATLVGEQPTTTMRIFREGDNAGRFLAPLALNVKLTFTPVGRGRALEAAQEVRFPADPRSSFVLMQNKSVSPYVKIDTDGDGRPDTLVPGPSNFRAGVRRVTNKTTFEEISPIDGVDYSTYVAAHTSPTHQHSTTPPPPPTDGEPITPIEP